MCLAVRYNLFNDEKIIYFTTPNVQLPILKRDGSIALQTWGRRKGEAGHLPLGACARLDSLKQGMWDEYFPIPVKLPIQHFAEKDIEYRSQWFSLVEGQCLQGVVARSQDEIRVYIVSIFPKKENTEFERWPRIIDYGF